MMELSEQQLEQASVAHQVIKELNSSNDKKELLVPVGNGVFFSVNKPALAGIKVAVGAGVVVDKSSKDALEFVSKQIDEIELYYQNLVKEYEELVLKAQELQLAIEKAM